MNKSALLLIGSIAIGGVLLTRNEGMEPTDTFTRFDELFKKYGRLKDVPWRWLKAIAKVESQLGEYRSVKRGLASPDDIEGSKSDDGLSWGLMQVTLKLAKELRPGTTERDLNNPEISVQLAATYTRQHMNRWPNNREYIIRAYNGGPGFLNTARGRTDTPIYYNKFLNALAEIMERQPGNELERG